MVKESDSKSDGLCPRGFESLPCRVAIIATFNRAVRIKPMIFAAGNLRACGVVVSRLLCMQKASGSNPDKSMSPY